MVLSDPANQLLVKTMVLIHLGRLSLVNATVLSDPVGQLLVKAMEFGNLVANCFKSYGSGQSGQSVPYKQEWFQERLGDMAKLCPQSPWCRWADLQQSPARLCGTWHGRREINDTRNARQAKVIANCGCALKELCCGRWQNDG